MFRRVLGQVSLLGVLLALGCAPRQRSVVLVLDPELVASGRFVGQSVPKPRGAEGFSTVPVGSDARLECGGERGLDMGVLGVQSASAAGVEALEAQAGPWSCRVGRQEYAVTVVLRKQTARPRLERLSDTSFRASFKPGGGMVHSPSYPDLARFEGYVGYGETLPGRVFCYVEIYRGEYFIPVEAYDPGWEVPVDTCVLKGHRGETMTIHIGGLEAEEGP